MTFSLTPFGIIHPPHKQATGTPTRAGLATGVQDIIDNTPLPDIKPYLPAFDALQATRIGWCAHVQCQVAAADNHFDGAGPDNPPPPFQL